jgi:hypothetical protein
MRLARLVLLLGCVVLVGSAVPLARPASAEVSGPDNAGGIAQVPVPVPVVPPHGRGVIAVPVPVPVPVPAAPPPPPPPVLQPPRPPRAGFPAVPIIPEADSLFLLVGGLGALGVLAAGRRLRGRGRPSPAALTVRGRDALR